MTWQNLQEKMIDVSMLTPREIEFMNAYHARCRRELEPILQEMGLVDGAEWMLRESAPIAADDNPKTSS